MQKEVQESNQREMNVYNSSIIDFRVTVLNVRLKEFNEFLHDLDDFFLLFREGFHIEVVDVFNVFHGFNELVSTEVTAICMLLRHTALDTVDDNLFDFFIFSAEEETTNMFMAELF